MTRYLLTNTKTGAFMRYMSEAQAVNAARNMGWTDYTIERIEG